MDIKKFQGATIEDLMKNPKAYGLPTFQEFSKNPMLMRKRDDQAFAEVDNGSQSLGKVAKNYTYELITDAGLIIKCDSLEAVETEALNHGMKLNDMIYSPEVRDEGGGLGTINVQFKRKPSSVGAET